MHSHSWRLFPAWLGLAVLLWALAFAGQAVAAQAQKAPRLDITVGKSMILKTTVDITRVSVADPAVADFVLLSPRQVYVAGKTTGVTNIILWGEGEQVRGLYDIEVAPDLTRLKRLIGELMPDETGVEVRSANAAIALSGTIKSEANLKRLVTLAEAHAPGKVLNLVQVGGVHQVMLEVKVAEMSRTLAKTLGININAISQGDFLYTFLGGLTSLPALSNIVTPYTTTDANGNTIVDPYNKVNHPSRFDPQTLLNVSSKTQGMMNVNTNINGQPVTLTGFINILKDTGLVKILAEPTLVCLNGQTAQFLAGGEIPVPIPQALGSITIEWKKFGVELAFTPNVLGDKISMQVAPSVSELDFTRAIQVGSFTVPAINKRSASTVIELADGQSFAIAGLLREDARDTASKFLGVGDVPVLGSLFKSSSFQKNQTELLIIITPR
ncbi:MAG TPA: type II and III secretion system protein family protein, partial [Holophaga sp.]|nr:type II and III secretion system protein family protein [Holophaga sp.]